jgi:hypothetical protein
MPDAGTYFSVPIHGIVLWLQVLRAGVLQPAVTSGNTKIVIKLPKRSLSAQAAKVSQGKPR